MSVSRPATCLICSFTKFISRNSPARRKLTSSATRLQRKPKHASIKAPVISEPQSTKVPEYTEEELARLEKKLPPSLFAAIKAGEAAIPPDVLQSAGLRQDPWRLRYQDDKGLMEIDGVVDKPVRAPYSNTDPTQRLKDDDELDEDLTNFIRDLPDTSEHAPETKQAAHDDAWGKFEKNLRLTIGREEAELHPRSALAPQLFYPGETTMNEKPPKKKGGAAARKKYGQQAQDEEASPALIRLMQMTGFTRQQIAALRVKSIITHAVVNQTRLGKIRKQYFLSIAGNEKGLIGVGEGKAEEPNEARLQSQYRAIRNMQPVLRYENRTIFGDVKGKVSATELELYARPPGFGLRCQQYIWEICRCAGISDLAARVTRSRNPMNTVKATVEALLSQKDPEEIARARGKKLVDVRKVYYAGFQSA